MFSSTFDYVELSSIVLFSFFSSVIDYATKIVHGKLLSSGYFCSGDSVNFGRNGVFFAEELSKPLLLGHNYFSDEFKQLRLIGGTVTFYGLL